MPDHNQIVAEIAFRYDYFVNANKINDLQNKTESKVWTNTRLTKNMDRMVDKIEQLTAQYKSSFYNTYKTWPKEGNNRSSQINWLFTNQLDAMIKLLFDWNMYWK